MLLDNICHMVYTTVMVNSSQLIQLGFSSREADVYLALLELGPATATVIARKSKINRTTCYDILENLIRKKVVTIQNSAKIQKFTAENPRKLVSFLEQSLEQEEKKLKNAVTLLPELLSLFYEKEKPSVKFYTGIQEIKEAFEDTLQSKTEILVYAVGTSMFDAIDPEYFKEYSKKKASKNIKVRVIAPDDEVSKEITKYDKENLRESLLVPKDDFYFTTETNIYDNKLLVISWKEKFAVVVESKEITDAQRKIFELAWLGAKQMQG